MPVRVVFGEGSARTLGELCPPHRRALVVTGRRSSRASGALDMVLAQFSDAVVFDEVDENPCTDTCDRGAALCRAEGCDLVIALGGGSPIDAAKAIAGLALNEGPCAGFFGRETFPHGALPVTAVPTTAGTGSEVTPYSVLVDAATRTKRTIGGTALYPHVAVLDPILTVSMRPEVTRNTGLDALCQAMEGFVSRKSTPPGDALALEACRILRAWLPVAVRDGSDRTARGHVLYAAMLSGCVIAQSGTTLVHGMGYAYTLGCGVPHGLANALLLAPVFAHNARCLPEKCALLAGALGHKADAADPALPEIVARAIHGVLTECGAPVAARDAGVGEGLLGRFAAEVAADPYRFRNQPGDIGERECHAFYRASWAGTA
jgi:alcohol dehydrogenase class IV